MSKVKDASSKLHDKHQTILADLLRDEDNKYCADCKAKGPRWASWNLGVFMCIRCAGIHRNLGVHISRVKSVNLDSWTPEQIESIQKGGNGHARGIYEASLPVGFRRPQDDYAVEQFIRAKYERKLYLSKDKETSTTVKESQEQKAKNKTVKKPTVSSSTQKSSRDQVLSVPRPTGSGRSGSGRSRSPSPQPPKPATASTKSSSSSLIELDSSTSSTRSSKKSSPQPAVDLLTGLSPSGDPAPSSSNNKVPVPQTSAQAKGTAPSIGGELLLGTQQLPSGGSDTKDSIMSLYGAQSQPQLSSYTAQGYPVNNLYYQQQQEAAMRMTHMAALQQHQVNRVTQQMQDIKQTQQHHVAPPLHNGPAQPFPNMSTGTVPTHAGMGMGGQTLNPTLW